ncbi:hypothetical protein D1820_18710 (plasmid) [Phaeobacter sp. LSS9]|nr:hypothetical protein D1820_18710 [Phaeobacter sp. LSS9]
MRKFLNMCRQLTCGMQFSTKIFIKYRNTIQIQLIHLNFILSYIYLVRRVFGTPNRCIKLSLSRNHDNAMGMRYISGKIFCIRSPRKKYYR